VQILHGRRICRPKPLCDKCSVAPDCNYYALSGGSSDPPRTKKRQTRRV
jgi:hypothetical protein